MICSSLRSPWLRGFFLDRLRRYAQSIAECQSSRVVEITHYSQSFHRLFKTSSILTLSNVSNTSFGKTEVITEGAEQDVGMKITLEEQILNSFSDYPDLAQVPVAQLKNCLCNLRELGFSVDDGIVMAYKCKSIIGRSKSQLLESIMGLRQCKFGDEEVVSILRSSPEHLCVDPSVIVSRYSALREHFSQKSLKSIYSNCHRIGLMNWEAIRDKMDYLRSVMNAPSHEIAQSTALDSPIIVIKTRHLFLERAGLYKKPNSKSRVPNNNPNLSKIIDTEDVVFATEVAGLTAEEFFVFQELILLEDDEGGIDVDMENF